MNKAEDIGLLKALKIQSTIATTNIVCFDKDGRLKRYSGPEDVMREFYPLRLEYYSKRKVSKNPWWWGGVDILESDSQLHVDIGLHDSCSRGPVYAFG